MPCLLVRFISLLQVIGIFGRSSYRENIGGVFPSNSLNNGVNHRKALVSPVTYRMTTMMKMTFVCTEHYSNLKRKVETLVSKLLSVDWQDVNTTNIRGDALFFSDTFTEFQSSWTELGHRQLLHTPRPKKTKRKRTLCTYSAAIRSSNLSCISS